MEFILSDITSVKEEDVVDIIIPVDVKPIVVKQEGVDTEEPMEDMFSDNLDLSSSSDEDSV